MQKHLKKQSGNSYTDLFDAWMHESRFIPMGEKSLQYASDEQECEESGRVKGGRIVSPDGGGMRGVGE